MHYYSDYFEYRRLLSDRFPLPELDGSSSSWDAMVAHCQWIDLTAIRLSSVERLATRKRITSL